MHVSYGLKYASFVVTGCMFKSGRVGQVGQGCSSRSVKSVRFGQSVPSGAV